MKKTDIIRFGKKIGINEIDILKVLEKITDLDSSQLFLIDEIGDKFIEKIEYYFSRLVNGEPIEYILQKAEFYGFDFYVDSRVLIPRNDTELMVEQTLMVPVSNVYIDIGTGSGVVLISILNKLKEKRVPIPLSFVIDISKDALEVSKINIKKYNLEDKIKQIHGDLLENFSPHLIFSKREEYENIIITANLPYIKNGDFENMDEETINFEPDLALYGGEKTGFELYEKLIYQIFELKKEVSSIILFIEIGFDQKEIAINFLKKQALKFEIFKDNGGVDRCVKIYF